MDTVLGLFDCSFLKEEITMITSKRGQMNQQRWVYRLLVALAVVTLFGAAAPTARADTYNFLLTDTNNIIDVTFTIPYGFSPDSVFPGSYFELNSVSYLLNGSPEDPVPMSFWNAGAGGGLMIGDFSNIILNQGGAQIYSGSEGAPTFIPGVYNFVDWGGALLNDDFTLTLTQEYEPTSTPEPSSLLLLGSGLLGLGGLTAFRKKLSNVVAS